MSNRILKPIHTSGENYYYYYCALVSNEDGTISWAPGVKETMLAARAAREEKDNYPLFPIEEAAK